LKRSIFLFLFVALIPWSGCGKSGSGAQADQDAEKLKQDLRQTGQDLKVAADQAATQLKPVMEKAKEDSRVVIHDVAQKIADETATQPAQQR
jgi:hypothetical protein